MRTKEIKGITIISLVVTIVVLLILAGVSISTLVGENGIVDNIHKACVLDFFLLNATTSNTPPTETIINIKIIWINMMSNSTIHAIKGNIRYKYKIKSKEKPPIKERMVNILFSFNNFILFLVYIYDSTCKVALWNMIPRIKSLIILNLTL